MKATIEDIDEALRLFGRQRTAEPEPVADSVLNDNYRIESGEGTYFLRFIQSKRTREVVEAEHRAMLFAAENGIPVAVPQRAVDGGTVAEVGGVRVALFPWVSGYTARRGHITPAEAALLGETQARIQAAFAGYSDPVLWERARGETEWDTAASIATLHRIDAAVAGQLYGVDERHVRRAVRMQLFLLESGMGRPPGDFSDIPVQIDHGDYHERNVILAEGGHEVVAVVDWERIRPLPAAFQLMRALDFMGLLSQGPLDEYLAAFGGALRFEPAVIHLAVEQWWQSVLHNTWTFTEVFERGNSRPARFLDEIEPRLRMLSSQSFRESLAERITSHAGI